MRKNTSKIFLFLDKFLSPPPNFVLLNYNDRLKHYFIQIFKSNNTLLDILKFLRYFFLFILSYLLLPISFILKIFNFKFINIDLSQIGSLTYLDLLIRESLIKKNIKKYRTFALASYFSDGNSYLINLYSEYVVFVRNPFLKFFLSPFFMSILFEDNSFKYDMVNHTSNKSHKIWNDYFLVSKGKNLIEFPAADRDRIKKLLNPYIKKDKFVVLHVRDQFFYKRKSIRDADINTYKNTIIFLINTGYSVVRLGDANSYNIEFNLGNNFFDYSKFKNKSPEIDIYLLSHCNFFIGCSSGPADVPKLFGVNSCNVNHYTLPNAFNFLHNDLTSIKKFKYKNNNKIVPYEKLLEDPLSKNPSSSTLNKLGIYVEDNSPEEILYTVKEFIDRRRSNPKLQIIAKSKLNKYNYGVNAAGNLSTKMCEILLN